MKRVLTFAVTLALLLSVLSSGITAVAATYRRGDVDGNNTIATMDARVLLRWLVGSGTLTADQQIAADYTFDGKINTSDAKAIMLGAVNGESNVLQTVDLLAPTADSWHNPVLASAGAKAIVNQEKLANGGYRFTNIGGIWPYATYIYDELLLLPTDAVIEYDITMTCAQTSINLYVGDSLPDLYGDAVNDTVAHRECVKLNSLISSTKLDAGSGDLLKGTYKGTIKVSDLKVSNSARVAGMIALSAIKVYPVGSSGSTLTINKLQVKAYKEPTGRKPSAASLEAVRTSLVDKTETFGMQTLSSMEVYENGERTAATVIDPKQDIKKLYNTITKTRIIDYARGYQVDVPFDWQEDYTLGAIRGRYENEHFSLTLTREDQSPYGNTASGWETYRTEWLDIHINNSKYLSANGMTYQRTPVVSTTMLSGYEVRTYDIAITDTNGIDKPYYSIAVIRETDVYNVFYLMILKGDVPTASVVDRLVRSFKQVTMTGTPANTQGQYEVTMPANWSAETKAYYEKLLSQQETDFGFFSASMVQKNDGSYMTQRQKILSEYNRLSRAIGYDYAIMPTYSHLLYGSNYNDFPLDMANEFAGGNGFNGKPVLQFTYQFTANNNSDLTAKNVSFDVLRGKYDTQFRKIAKDIKSYAKPVLFRLNNEMNTDWTSYCGIASLLDPDIFVQTWQRMYDIFEEEGVNNCIWIFNPITPSTPYCAWGDALCYMPGQDYVQILGLTNYEMGNNTTLTSFKSRYTACYDAFDGYFTDYPWVISEFAAGSGGEKLYDWGQKKWLDTTLGRNADQQAQWVRDMFVCLNNKELEENAFCRNIVGAVWFSVNDYTTINNTNYIVNYLALDAQLTDTIAAFKEGLGE